MSKFFKKAKHPEAVVVHRKDGKTFTRVQQVGSDKEPTKVKHPIHKFIDEDKRKEYDDFLHNLREIDGKYYNKEKIDKPSTGRTSFGRGKYDGLVEYKLHPSEISYKKQLHKERGEPKHDKKETEFLSHETIYNSGIFPQRTTDVSKKIEDVNKQSSESIHKRLKTDYGKKIISAEDKKIEKEKEKIIEESNKRSEEMFKQRIQKVNDKLTNVEDFSTLTIKQFFDKFKVDLAGLNSKSSNLNIEFETLNGQKQIRPFNNFKNWVKGIVEDLNPAMKEAKIPFKKMTIKEQSL